MSNIYVPLNPLTQCDCEAEGCTANNGHTPGGCKHIPHVKVRAFGWKENLCQACLRHAQTTIPDKLEILSYYEAQ